MKNLILALMFVYSGAALAADNPDWAYPVTPPPESKDNVIMKSVPGSTKQYTQAQIDDICGAAPADRGSSASVHWFRSGRRGETLTALVVAGLDLLLLMD